MQTIVKTTTAISVALLLANFIGALPADAKLGEDIAKYKAKVAKAYTFKSQSEKAGKSYDVFSINVTPEIKKVAPEFGGGLTITVDKGKITGQSMVLRLGKNEEIGKAIAVRYALDFAFEALGRSVPKHQKELVDEIDSYKTVIKNALAGDAQNVRYPNVAGKITVSKQKDGSLVFAATPG